MSDLEVKEQVPDATEPGGDTVGIAITPTQLWKGIAVGVLVSSLISAASLTAYDLLFRNNSKLATADLAEIVKIREIQFTALVNKLNVTDKERMEAWNLVNRIGPEIEKALDDVQQECGCTLVVKSAVLAGPQQDMTEALKAKLGLAGLSSKALMEVAPRPAPQGGNLAPPSVGGAN